MQCGKTHRNVMRGDGVLANQAIHLTVNTISGNAGIYIGNQNITTGVSGHSKTNNAVGSIESGARFTKNLCVVYDPDMIDTPIDDRDVHVFAPYYDHPAAHVQNARLDTLNSETINQNAGIFFGETAITGFDSHQKSNYGTGPVYGAGLQSTRNVNVIFDRDAVDGVMDDRDIKSGIFISPAGGVQTLP